MSDRRPERDAEVEALRWCVIAHGGLEALEKFDATWNVPAKVPDQGVPEGETSVAPTLATAQEPSPASTEQAYEVLIHFVGKQEDADRLFDIYEAAMCAEPPGATHTCQFDMSLTVCTDETCLLKPWKDEESSEADTIREDEYRSLKLWAQAGARLGLKRHAEVVAALTALERRAEQAERERDKARSEMFGMLDRAEQAERERDEWRQGKARAMVKLEQAEAERDALVAVIEAREAVILALQKDVPPSQRIGLSEHNNPGGAYGRAATTPGGKTPFEQVTDDLTGGCGCACHTGTGYRSSCQHCATTPGQPPTCPTCDQFGYIANLACSDDFHRATTPRDNEGSIQRGELNQTAPKVQSRATTPGEPRDPIMHTMGGSICSECGTNQEHGYHTDDCSVPLRRATTLGEPERCPTCRTRFPDRPLAGCTDAFHSTTPGEPPTWAEVTERTSKPNRTTPGEPRDG